MSIRTAAWSNSHAPTFSLPVPWTKTTLFAESAPSAGSDHDASRIDYAVRRSRGIDSDHRRKWLERLENRRAFSRPDLVASCNRLSVVVLGAAAEIHLAVVADRRTCRRRRFAVHAIALATDQARADAVHEERRWSIERQDEVRDTGDGLPEPANLICVPRVAVEYQGSVRCRHGLDGFVQKRVRELRRGISTRCEFHSDGTRWALSQLAPDQAPSAYEPIAIDPLKRLAQGALPRAVLSQ